MNVIPTPQTIENECKQHQQKAVAENPRALKYRTSIWAHMKDKTGKPQENLYVHVCFGFCYYFVGLKAYFYFFCLN